MNIKNIVILTVLLEVTLARRRKVIPPQPAKPTTLVLIQNAATPEPTFKDPEVRCIKKKKTYYSEQLVNPPPALELPCGLGYFPSALPLVAKSFQPEFDPYEKRLDLPIAECMTLAAPLGLDYEYLAKSIIL